MAKFTADIISQNLAVMPQDTALDRVQNQELALPTKERGSGGAGPPRVLEVHLESRVCCLRTERSGRDRAGSPRSRKDGRGS